MHYTHLNKRTEAMSKRGFPKKSFALRTSTTSRIFYQSILEGIHKVTEEVGINIQGIDLDAITMGDGFPYLDSVVNNAKTNKKSGFGEQADACTIYNEFATLPLSDEEFVGIMVVDSDLTNGDPNNNFVYGMACFPHLVISTKRYESLPNPKLGLEIVAAHEFGHVIGLVARDKNVGKGDYLDNHCNGEKGPCLMEQVDVPGAKRLEYQIERLHNQKNLLCRDCVDEAKYKLKIK